MQASRQYEMPEVPQYLVGRVPTSHSHMFHLSHEISLSPTSGQAHPLCQSPQLQHPHHLQHQLHHTQQHPPHHSQPQQVQLQPQLVESHQPQQKQQLQPPLLQQQPNRQSQLQQEQAGLAPDSPKAASPIASRVSLNENYSKALVVKDQSLSVSEDHDGLVEEGERAGNRWPRQETLALLKIRSDMDVIFRDSNLKGPLWEEVSRKLSEMGYHRNAKKCKEKFENVHKYYKRTKNGKTGRQDGKNYRFYSQLEALYGNMNVLNDTVGANTHNPATGGRNGSGGVGSELTNSQGDREGFLLPRGTTGGTNGHADGAGFVHPEFNYSSSLNFSSDSSDDDFENPAESENPENKKRKRKSLRQLMLFFENLMKKVLGKQEEMQRMFLEALERREQDRMIRDEAWKRQEMTRMSKEHELRAQERALAATRDAALVAFLEKVTGQTLHLPQIPLPVQPLSTASDIPEDQHDEKDPFFDPNSKRWPKAEVFSFIKLRSAMEPRFHEPGPKSPLWEEISSLMASLGYNRSSKRCKEKWENINKYFKKAKEGNKKRPENAKTCPYFHQLDTLYSKGLLGAHKQLVHKVEDHPEELLEEPSGSNREDSCQAQGGDSEMLAIIPAGDNATGKTSNTNVVGATHFFRSPENGSCGDRGTSKLSTTHNMMDTTLENPLGPASESFDEMNNREETPASTKTEIPDDQAKGMQADMQLHETVTDDYEKMDLEEAATGQDAQQRQFHYDRQTSSNRDASLMALVHKFTDDPPEYSIAAAANAD